MKIKNEAIVIRNGKKIYEFKNLILDAYLKELAEAQTSVENTSKIGYQKALKFCLLKFEDELSFNKESNLPNETFDVCYMGDDYITQIGNTNQITVQYDAYFNKNTFVYDYSARTGGTKFLEKYYGKKITAIGWNDYWTPTLSNNNFVPVKAILDVSRYNFYLQENQEISITRKDIITTDSLFWANTSKIGYPVHLAPANIENIYEQKLDEHEYWDNEAYPLLYSVGFSNNLTYMLKEYVIGKDVNLTIDNNILKIENIPNIRSIAVTYLTKFLPFYPTRSNYKYILIKYKIYQRLNNNSGDDIESKEIDTGYYYHIAIPITDAGNKNLIIKYERG